MTKMVIGLSEAADNRHDSISVRTEVKYSRLTQQVKGGYGTT